MSLLALPPIVYFLAGAALYPLALLLRRAGGTVALGVALIVALAFIVLPGGRDLTDRAGQLPDRPQRLRCAGQAILRGAPLAKGARSAPACEFAGRGLPGRGDPHKAREMLRRAHQLLR